jgi:hypothetical protein
MCSLYAAYPMQYRIAPKILTSHRSSTLINCKWRGRFIGSNFIINTIRSEKLMRGEIIITKEAYKYKQTHILQKLRHTYLQIISASRCYDRTQNHQIGIINSKIIRYGDLVASTDVILIPTFLKILQFWYLGFSWRLLPEFYVLSSGVYRRFDDVFCFFPPEYIASHTTRGLYYLSGAASIIRETDKIM